MQNLKAHPALLSTIIFCRTSLCVKTVALRSLLNRRIHPAAVYITTGGITCTIHLTGIIQILTYTEAHTATITIRGCLPMGMVHSQHGIMQITSQFYHSIPVLTWN